MSSSTESDVQTDERWDESGDEVDEEAALARARSVSKMLDSAFKVPGTNYRVGVDPLLGIAPISGDAVAAVGALYIVLEGIKVGVPLRETLGMLAFIAADFAVGSIPILGTLIDAGWKVNERNVAVIESHVEGSG